MHVYTHRYSQIAMWSFSMECGRFGNEFPLLLLLVTHSPPHDILHEMNHGELFSLADGSDVF